MYSIAVCRLNDSTISNIDGVGTESISAPFLPLYHFLADMDDGTDMESAPTVVISMIP
jgi:hypothetical protein